MAWACNSRSGKGEKRGSWGLQGSQPSLTGEFGNLSQKIKWTVLEEWHYRVSSGLCTHAHLDIHRHIDVHTHTDSLQYSRIICTNCSKYVSLWGHFSFCLHNFAWCFMQKWFIILRNTCRFYANTMAPYIQYYSVYVGDIALSMRTMDQTQIIRFVWQASLPSEPFIALSHSHFIKGA